MSNIPTLRQTCVALMAAGTLAGALAAPIGSATAQTTITETRDEITIYAPRVQHQTIGRSDIGAPIEQLSLTRGVDYSDLDLSRWTDVQLLDDRIQQAAFAACGELNREYPDTLDSAERSGDRNCITKATNEGRAQAQLIVARWNGYPPR